jgi:hypothetical protein
METTSFYSSAEWLAARDRALSRDASRCTVARLLGGECRGVLHVHHVVSVADRPDLALDPDNLGTACASHHSRWEALARALRVVEGVDIPPCPHRHLYESGRRACEAKRRRAAEARRLARLAAA